MDMSHDSMSFSLPEPMDGDVSQDTLSENEPAESHDAANVPEAARSTLTRRNASDESQEHSERVSTSPARTSPSQAANDKEGHDSIKVSQQDAVRALRKYTTLTSTEIFRRVGVSASGGYRYLRGEDIKDKETRGRKRKLDEAVVNRIIHEIESQPVGEKTRPWEELCKMAGVEGVAPVTLKRAVESAGYYKCSHCQRGTFHSVHMGRPRH
jgi:transposase